MLFKDHETDVGVMFCLVDDEKIQIISADSKLTIKNYKIASLVLLLFEKKIYLEIYYNDWKIFEETFYVDFRFRDIGKISSKNIRNVFYSVEKFVHFAF